MKAKLQELEQDITTYARDGIEYICITDIARYKHAERTDDLIRNWLRNRNTIEFLGIWEQLNNPGFNPVEFDGFRKQTGLNSFTLTSKQWIERIAAVGLMARAGRLVKLNKQASRQMRVLVDKGLSPLPPAEAH